MAPPGGRHVVTLQTDGLMTDPDLLRAEGLEAAYRDFWREASGGSTGTGEPGAFALARFFARQSLHGGYLTRRAGRGGYEPYLVTDRGSVFVLEPTGRGRPDEVLKRWRAGLPVPKWVETRYGLSGKPLWQSCPFLPHVGFGEIAIDLACHTTHQRPKA